MSANVSPGPERPVVSKKTRWFLFGFGAVLAFVLMIVATVAITLWWIQRPIKPVVLSPQETAVVHAKLQYLEAPTPPPTPAQHPAGSVAQSSSLPPSTVETPPEKAEVERPYVPGGKVLKLTQREVNGLLNANTDLGHSVRLEFASDAINAYVVVPIPQDFPIGGGKMFRAKGRFRLSLDQGGAPYAILEDVTVFGLSLPKAWLGGLKGENLLADAMKSGQGAPVVRGIKSLHVEPGALVLEVED
jgi:hypothetical protein